MAAALTAPPVGPVSGHRPPPATRHRPTADAPPARQRTPAGRYVWRRIVAAIVAAQLLIGAVLLVAAAVTAVVTSTASPAASYPLVSAPGHAEPEVIVVREGDTLWSIARELDPEGDPRAVVAQLAERSGGAGLRPGQRLRVDGLR